MEAMWMPLAAALAIPATALATGYRVSAAVGLMLAPLLGIRGAAAQRVVDLGLALQLSNILLGIRGDARRDGVYCNSAIDAACGRFTQTARA